MFFLNRDFVFNTIAEVVPAPLLIETWHDLYQTNLISLFCHWKWVGPVEKYIVCYSETSKENEITQVTGKSVLDRNEGKVQISGNSQESNLSHVCVFRKSTGTAGFVLFFFQNWSLIDWIYIFRWLNNMGALFLTEKYSLGLE